MTVVGIGASAGGLEAFDHFFLKIPPHSGLAFVIVQHLDPSHSSLLTEILQRNTSLAVIEAQDQMVVEADCVYVIPPNRDMTFSRGILHLNVPKLPRGKRMPIDLFFISLARDRYAAAIGIVLSGTGTDGTLGAQVVTAEGGLVLVQAPASAKYDGMPSSVINAGFATHVMPVEDMPALLLAEKKPSRLSHPASSGINNILLVLRKTTGHDFSLYKKTTIGRRIERRMAVHHIDDPHVYARFISKKSA